MNAVESRDLQPGPSSHLEVTDATKRFGRFTALEAVTFKAGRGELLCVLGPSGCGKTTLLRIVAGLEKQDHGSVHIGGREVSDLPASRRNIGIVFQSYALFPNLTVDQNVAYGLVSRRRERNGVRERVRGLLELVKLGGFGHKYPAQLSGGQQQRVALARAMALSPDLLLLDEPLSALDAQVRVMLRAEIRQLQRELGITTLMVTHDQEEALTMADRILVMDAGKIAQCGTPMEIYDHPANPFVASFIGAMNFIEPVERVARDAVRLGAFTLRIENGWRETPSGATVTVAIRPEEVLIPTEQGSVNRLSGLVTGLEFRGAVTRATLELPVGPGRSSVIHADLPTEQVRRLGIREQMNLAVRFPPDRIRMYAA